MLTQGMLATAMRSIVLCLCALLEANISSDCLVHKQAILAHTAVCGPLPNSRALSVADMCTTRSQFQTSGLSHVVAQVCDSYLSLKYRRNLMNSTCSLVPLDAVMLKAINERSSAVIDTYLEPSGLRRSPCA